jgi:hypothetical protein
MVVFKQLHVAYSTAEDMKNPNPLTAKSAKVFRKERKEVNYMILTLRTLRLPCLPAGRLACFVV